jgi:thiamine-phosphate pyrophosphorylase
MLADRPIICLVTDRHRLAARLELAPGDPGLFDRLDAQVRSAAAAGVTLVQVREPDLDARQLAPLVRRLIASLAGTRTRLVVNDRLDVALACDADGVHLSERSIPAARVRDVAPPKFLVGQSRHQPEQCSDVDADYIVFGTVFATPSKPAGHELAGLSGVRAAVERASVPLLAIGGIGLDEVAAVADAGASGVAAVDLFLPDGPRSVNGLHEIVSRVRKGFDTSSSVT